MQSVDTNMNVNAESLKQLFQKSDDVQFQYYTFNQQKVMFITCEAMVDQHILNEVIVERVQSFFDESKQLPFEQAVKSYLHIPGLIKVETKDELLTEVYLGKLIIYFEAENAIYSCDISKKPNRSPEETRTEVLVKGPRDNFIEDIATNIALIRKRIPTNSMCVEKLEVGKRTKTTIAILYFDDIANQEILAGLKENINKIDIDVLSSGEMLMELIDKRSTLFPRHNYTGRADYALQNLARGRFIILIDGVSYAIIVPINLFLLFKAGEDDEFSIPFTSLERLLRLTGMLVGTLLPAFWLALTTFHQNQLPLLMLATVVGARTGLPFPSDLEMILMLFMFDLFREFGLRLPAALGGTISVVGGLIIGDAAIRAGITSPAMVVIIATSVIASYTLVNQSLVAAVSILRYFCIILTALFGLFGLLISFYCIILYLANMRTFGVPYLAVAADLRWSTVIRTIFRMPAKRNTERPNELNPTDQKRQK